MALSDLTDPSKRILEPSKHEGFGYFRLGQVSERPSMFCFPSVNHLGLGLGEGLGRSDTRFIMDKAFRENIVRGRRGVSNVLFLVGSVMGPTGRGGSEVKNFCLGHISMRGSTMRGLIHVINVTFVG